MTEGARKKQRSGFARRKSVWAVATAAIAGAAVLIVTTTGGQPAPLCSASPIMLAAADASTSGEATYYTLASGGAGNCSLTAPADNLYVALSPGEYANGAKCGSYLEVKGPKSTIRVKVIDQCPECAAGHIDMSKTAFADIGDLSQGIIPVTYSTMVDPQLPGPLTAEVKSGSSQYWFAVMIDNIGNPLASVQAASAGGSMHALTRTNYNYWIAQSGLGSGPFTITVTDVTGHTTQLNSIALKPGTTQSTSAWMYGSGSGSGSVAAPAATTPPAAPTTPATTPSALVTTPAPPTTPPTTPATSPSPTQAVTAPNAADLAGAHGRC